MPYPQGDQLFLTFGDPQKNIQVYVNCFSNHLVPKFKSCTRDSTYIINILNGIVTLPDNLILFTLDFNILCMNILYQEGIKVIQELLVIHGCPTETPYNSYIVAIVRIILQKNCFDFNDRHYQIAGTVIDTKLTPSYVNIFMSQFEDKYV